MSNQNFKDLIKKAAIITLFILSFFIIKKNYYNPKFLSITLSAILSAASGLYFSFFQWQPFAAFASGVISGFFLPYPFNLLTGVLSLTFFHALKIIKKEAKFSQVFVSSVPENYLASFVLASFASEPFKVANGDLFYPLFMGFALYGSYILTEWLDERLFQRVYSSLESVFQILMIPVLSFLAFSLFKGYYLSAAFSVVAAFLVTGVKRRYFFFEAKDFVKKQALFFHENVFSTKETLESANSLAKAFEGLNDKKVSSDLIFDIYLYSTLAWLSFGKPLYRQPETLNVEEIELLRSNLLEVKEVLSTAGFSERLVKGIYHLYENYDGSGIPEGLEGDEIPLESRIVRVIEKYLQLTTWREGFEPLSDEDAMAEIEKYGGVFFDPEAVKQLKEIIMPGKLELPAEDSLNKEGILKGEEEEKELASEDEAESKDSVKQDG